VDFSHSSPANTPMLRALGNGECGVTVANQYYLAPHCSHPRPLPNDRDPAAKPFRVVFPNPTHVNTSPQPVSPRQLPKESQGGHHLIEFLPT